MVTTDDNVVVLKQISNILIMNIYVTFAVPRLALYPTVDGLEDPASLTK